MQKQKTTRRWKPILATFGTVICLLLLVGVTELLLQRFLGLGQPVLYDASPLYGYRPLPNRAYVRYGGSIIQFNNVGLRTEIDWDEQVEGKILFLGDSVTYGMSYVDNTELFSHLVPQRLGTGYVGGNGAVSEWGVENTYGLVVESNLTPAETYVTVLREESFYQGLVRLPGLPFFNRTPKFALAELWYYFCYRQNNQSYNQWRAYADGQTRAFVVEKAVQKLKAMDTFLTEKGFHHLIIITPNKGQLKGHARKNKLIKDLLAHYQLTPYYIMDERESLALPYHEIDALYHDDSHLTQRGHEVWADMIASKLIEYQAAAGLD
ncbi:MAG: hypothetical protein AAF639_01305 [Chloroflexota bacterium]